MPSECYKWYMTCNPIEVRTLAVLSILFLIGVGVYIFLNTSDKLDKIFYAVEIILAIIGIIIGGIL